jgi:hypothetical protein
MYTQYAHEKYLIELSYFIHDVISLENCAHRAPSVKNLTVIGPLSVSTKLQWKMENSKYDIISTLTFCFLVKGIVSWDFDGLFMILSYS